MLSRITQRQLEYFVASGEAGSISAASERIHVSSPSISAAITHVEAELGIQLFIRHHAQGISLTAVGRQVMQEAKLILEQMSNLYTIASESLNTVRGPLRVGCLHSLAPMITRNWCLALAVLSQACGSLRSRAIMSNCWKSCAAPRLTSR